MVGSEITKSDRSGFVEDFAKSCSTAGLAERAGSFSGDTFVSWINQPQDSGTQ